MKRRSRNSPFAPTPNLRAKKATLLFLTFGLLLTACQSVPPLTPSASAAPSPTPTPFQPAAPEPITLWVSDAVPDRLHEAALSLEIPLADDASFATFRLDVSNAATASVWTYALVAPFPTIADGISGADLREIWNGNAPGPWAGSSLWMAESTKMAFTAKWGAASSGSVRTASSADLLQLAWEEGNALAIIPFEEIQPRWKALPIDGQSPLHNDFISENYPLNLTFGWMCDAPCAAPALPALNRDPHKLTVLMLTGVTALARTTAYKMETKGLTYPAQDVGDWLRAADITHLSSEVSFAEDCPPPDPYNTSMRFCSNPRYIEFFEYLGVDVVEATGNHLLDWGKDAARLTFDIYDEAGLPYYGGGRNLADAREPAFLEHNGHQFAFVGCNIVGPDYDWADEDSPGALPCDMDAMAETVRALRADGCLPIVTLQYYEYYSPEIRPSQGRDFRAMVDAGAVIVSGSQAHFPQAKEFYGDAFIDYGLGNLFFDQMDQPVKGTRREFIDRHIFYDGRYIGAELLTALLMDYARPVPMTDEARAEFLTDIFEASGWLEP